MKKSWLIRKVGLFILFITCATGNAYASRDDVLVIVNDNSIDSQAIGEYYAQRRDINPARIVHVKVPNQYYISWTEFQSLRDQILRFGVCPSITASPQPAACNDASQPIYTADNMAAFTANGSIRYIVTTRGVPTRMNVDGSNQFSANSSTSVDNYLRFWLTRYLTSDVSFASFNTRAKEFGDGRGMRTVAPPVDKEYVVGRIDGLDQASAKALVDRALSVEANGLYGKLYGSTFGSTGGQSLWKNYATNTPLYGDTSTGWRYAFGLLGEDRPECSDYSTTSHYFASSQTSASGKAPSYCLAQFNKGVPNETMQGNSASRSPLAIDALAYFGSLDGQKEAGGINTLLNWRKNDSCQVTLCANASDPAACRLASTDPEHEINTACVGVADGFMGYNFQSFPVSIMASWPTGWGPNSVDHNDPPVIVEATTSADGNNSLWFRQTDEEATTSCYVYANGNFDGSQTPCPSIRRIGLLQTVNAGSTTPGSPPSYHLAFQFKGQTIQKPATVSAFLRFIYPKDKNTDCPAGLTGAITATSCTYQVNFANGLVAGDSDWTKAQYDITPPSNTGINFTSVAVGFSGTITSGGVGIDAVSLQQLGSTTELLANGSFEGGHLQTANGDYAANFLSRLGGTAFWGSLSHHESLGHSFDQTSLGTFVYMLRGLPLGDAVWLGDPHSSGILYGDPLYSPMAVQLTVVDQGNDWNFVSGFVRVNGSAVNGSDSSQVATTYHIDYCSGDDFYYCGTATNPWLATGTAGIGGKKYVDFGIWNSSLVAPGKYVLRLQVTSDNASKGKSQSFYDYANVAVYNSTSDADGDGLSDAVELAGTYGTNPLKADTDGDGLTDGDEVNVYHTDPLSKDTDGDNVSDYDEVITYHSNPLSTDSDGDGYNDWLEVHYGGNPIDPLIVPLVITSTPITTAEVDVTYTYAVQASKDNVTYSLYYSQPGMTIDPISGVLTWKPGMDAVGLYRYAGIQVVSDGITNYQFIVLQVKAINDGDINEDSTIDAADSMLAQQIALGVITPSEKQRAHADIVYDQVIDISDVLKIQRKALGLE